MLRGACLRENYIHVPPRPYLAKSHPPRFQSRSNAQNLIGTFTLHRNLNFCNTQRIRITSNSWTRINIRRRNYATGNRTFYEILGVPQNADDATIKKAFLQKAKQYHPDKNKDNKNAQQLFIEISNAYDVLRDKNKRAAYDYELKHARASTPPFGRAYGAQKTGAGQRQQPRQRQYQYKTDQNTWQGPFASPDDFMKYYSKHYRDIFEELNEFMKQSGRQGDGHVEFERRYADGSYVKYESWQSSPGSRRRTTGFGFNPFEGLLRGIFEKTSDFLHAQRDEYARLDPSHVRLPTEFEAVEQPQNRSFALHVVKKQVGFLSSEATLGKVELERDNLMVYFENIPVAQAHLYFQDNVCTLTVNDLSTNAVLGTIVFTSYIPRWIPILGGAFNNVSVMDKNGRLVLKAVNIHLFGDRIRWLDSKDQKIATATRKWVNGT